MSRAIVLILCLVTAGAIAASSYDAAAPVDRSDTVKVYAVPARSETSVAVPAVPPPSPAMADLPTDKVTLTRQLQRELKRVGCYAGDINGVWTTSSRLAMKAFVDHVNASLPIHSPDPVLLSLVRGHPDGACVVPCPPGRACEPVAAGGDQTPSSVAPAAVAAAAASATIAATAAVPRAAAKPVATPDPALTAPPSDAARSGEPRTDTVNRKSARDRKVRRSWKDPARPPRFVRDFLRTVERSFKLP